MVTLVIFSFLLIMHVSCEQTNSLTFLIDNTSSMFTVLSQIKETAKSIVDIVTNVESCQVEDIVLVTFNDPRVEFRKRTRNAFELKHSLDEITVHGGGACPEPCLAGIKLAIEESQAGSYLYVFTDASAKDYAMLEEIISMSQEKKIQIVFIITGLCTSERDIGYQVYHKIAAACNGQVFRITEREVREVINYVKETIKGDLTVITSQMVESYQSWNSVGFDIDDEMKFVMVSAAGKQAFVIVLDQFLRPITDYDRITWTENVKVLKLSHLPPGSYTVKVRGSAEVNVKIIGRTDFTFDYGFSDNTTSSLTFTEPQPFKEVSTHLIISVNDKENSVVAQMVDILDMEERVIRALPLTNMGEKVYATEAFTPPDNMFKISVTAKGRSTGNPLRRIAKTPVAPIREVIVAPEIYGSEKYLSIIEGSPVAIHCRIIKGKPKPQVTWFYKPARSSTYTLLSGWTDMVIRKTYAILNDTGRYKCMAENAGGQVEHDVQLLVRAFLPLTRVPIAFVNRGQNVVIECRISKPHPPQMITWQFKRSDTNRIYNLNTTADVLRIENVRSIDSGYYRCSATSELGTAQQFVQLIIKVEPQIERFPSKIIKANEGSTVWIDCKITEAMPPPTVTWLFKAPNADGYQFLKANVTSLELRDVRVASNSGHYMCVAENSAGRAKQEVELVVEDMPVIEVNSPVFTEIEGNNVVIQCRITKGTPPPTVTWQYKNSESDIFRDIDNTGEILRITNLQLFNSGFYKCRASNDAGADQQTFQIIVLVIPQIESFPSKIIKAKQNSTVLIDCRVTKGSPSPNITWLFKAPDADRYQFLKTSVTSLELRDVRVASHSGHYMCVAENSAGRATQEVELVVEDIPVIENNSLIFTVKEGNNVVIQCRITKGTPPPTVTWQYKNSESDIFRDIDNTREILTITNLQLINSGFYKCRASNSAGADQQTVQIVVLVIPQIESFPTKIIKGNQNSTFRIDCRVTKGSPSPNITWLFKAPDADGYQFLKTSVTSLELRDVRVASHSGHYMCVAENSAGRATQEVELVVEDIPIIEINSPIFTEMEGNNVVVQCRITKGTPPPTVTWQYKNSESDIFRDIDITGEILRITNLQLVNSGFYKCRASNSAGADQQTVQIIVLVMPQIESFPSKIIKVEQNSTFRIECRVTKGTPSPNITWLFKEADADRYQLLKAGDTSLELRDVRVASNSGHYMCVAENSAGRATQEVELVIEDIPVIEINSPVFTEKEGNNVIVQCRITKGTPPPTVTWQYKNSESDIFRDIDITGEILRITNLQLFNSGFYKCRASNSAGADQQTVQIIVQVMPQIESFPSKIIKVEQNSTVRIECRVTKGTPSPNITWLFKAPDADGYQLLKAGVTSLELRDVRVASNSGHYMCVAENSAGRATQEVELVIEDIPVIEINSPIFTEREGNNVIIQCRITKGTPPPTVTWQYKNSESDIFRDIDNTGEVLTIKNLQLFNSGFYKCRASNSAGADQQTVQIIVQDIPVIEINSPILTEREGNNVVVQCRITKGTPPPTVTWQYKISESDIFRDIDNTGEILTITNLQLFNSGFYKCRALNNAGFAQETVQVIVLVIPQIENFPNEIIKAKQSSTVRIDCKVTRGTPSPNITWSFKAPDSDRYQFFKAGVTSLELRDVTVASNSGHYMCVAENSAGRATQEVELKVEDEPTIEVNSSIVSVKEGHNVDIVCKITKGTPPLTVTWQYKNSEFDTFLDIGNTGEILRITNLQPHNSGFYKCRALNNVGFAQQTVQIIALVPPALSKENGHITIKEGSQVTLSCNIIAGHPMPNIKWRFRAKDSIIIRDLPASGDKYIISSSQLENAGFYDCIVQNDAGLDEHTMEVTVEAAPQIEMMPNICAKENSSVRIDCRVTKGFPTPNITWFFKSSKGVSYDVLKYALTPLELVNVTVDVSGHYKCVAENSAGSAEQAVELLVEVPPRIVFSPPNEPKYRGVEGDVVMKLSCIAEGHPKPIISWTIDNMTIGTDKLERTYVEDGSLLVKSPMSANSNNTYACSAENEFGHDYQIYEVIVSEYEDYDNPAKMYGEVAKPYEINCSLPFTEPNSVRTRYTYLNVTGASIRWENASQANDGNYTCRVSDLSGTASVTGELTFGLPPTTAYSTTEWEVEWDDNLGIACVADMDSSGKYEWYYNGEKIEDADEKWLSVYKFGYGNYTCRASNSWGSLDITYNIPSRDCVIDKSLSKEKHMPIILDNSLEWPIFSSNQKFIVIPQSEKLTLICQVEPPLSKSVQTQALSNSFKKFPGTRSTVAMCDHEDLFLIDGVSYKISELDCVQPVTPNVVNTEEQCLGDNTQMIDVGFYVDDFIKVYSSCWDTNRNLLLYTIVTMKGLDKLWKVNEPEKPCKQVGDCCYEIIELVNAEDVGFGGAEGATLKEQLNSVLYCRPSEDTASADSSSRQQSTQMPFTTTESRIEPAETSPSPNAASTTEPPSQEPETSWHDIEREVRNGPQMTVWSGAGNYTRAGDMMVPQYLWKVVKDSVSGKTVAIIHSNTQAPVPKLCADDCRSPSVLALFEPHGDRTYCCNLNEFKTAFNLDIAF